MSASRRVCSFLALFSAIMVCAATARAEINIRPDALTHYSHCMSHAVDRGKVFLLDRGTVYRCGDDIAVSYFNYLGKTKAPERRVSEPEGVFIYRTIGGIGKCWNQIEDPAGVSVSVYGCDIYVEL